MSNNLRVSWDSDASTEEWLSIQANIHRHLCTDCNTYVGIKVNINGAKKTRHPTEARSLSHPIKKSVKNRSEI